MPFMTAFRANRVVMDGIQLFGEIRRTVMLNKRQRPECPVVRNAGHEGGDFRIVRKK